MTQALIVAPVALAVVLVVSGVAKVRDPAASDAGFRELRVPAALSAPWLRRAVPWVELVLAAALVAGPPPVGLAAAWGALGLFVVYTVLIVRAWRAPGKADCNCFGSLASGRVTGATVVRNVVLDVLSVAAVADAVASGWVAPRFADAGVLAWLAAVALVALLVGATLRPVPSEPEPDAGRATQAPDDAVEATEYIRLPIPYGSLTRPDGEEVSLRLLAAHRAQLLLWVSMGCGPCRSVVGRMAEWIRDMPEIDVRPVVSSEADRQTLAERVPETSELILLDNGHHAGTLFEVRGTPGAVLLGADARLAGGPVEGPDVIQFGDDIRAQLREAIDAVAE